MIRMRQRYIFSREVRNSMIPLSAHELRYLGQAERTPEDEIRRAEHVKKVHAWLRSHFPEDQKDAPIIRVHVDGKYDPNKDYSQDYTRRRKKTVSE